MGGSGRVFLCPGRQRGQKALYLGQTSLHSGRAQSLFYLGFLSLPRGSGVNRCSHTDLEGPSITRESEPQLLSPFPAFRRPLASSRGGRDWTMRSFGDWDKDLKSAFPESHQLRDGRTGSALGSTRACWSCGRPPNGDAIPFPSQDCGAG